MNSIIKIYFYFALISCVFQCLKCYKIGGKCGFPGLPHETKIEPQKSVYEDGEEVRYSCPNDGIYVKSQMKRCVSGEWKGNRSTCGYFIRNQISRVIVIDLTTNETVVDMTTVNMTEEEYPVSYFDERGTALMITEPHRPLKWWFHFSNPIFFDFFLLNVRIPNTKTNTMVPINEIDAIRVKDVEVLNEYNRTCALDFSTRQKWAKIFWFWCTESNNQIVDKLLTISFITYANQKMESIGLHQVYLTKLQYCGHPPVPLLAKYVTKDEETQQIQCDPELAIQVSKPPVIAPAISEEGFMDCIDKEYWAGNPKCMPKTYCELDFDNTTEEISSVRNAYIFSKTYWYAIEGTAIYFSCKPGNGLIGDFVRTCQNNSTWDQLGPVCKPTTYKEEAPSTDTMPSKYMFPIILVSIIVTIVVILLIVLIVMKRRKSNDSEMRTKNEFNTGVYDDITQSEEYSDYNYFKTDEYNKYENPIDNSNADPRYESQERTLLSDQSYLTLCENVKRESNQYMNMEHGQQ